jgi:hypothetical protein
MSSSEHRIIQLELTPEEVNLIIEGLGSLPFKNVYKIIEKIHLCANVIKNNKSH